MKIYTKIGDNGTTQLLGGKKVSKSHTRLCAYGSIDELNAHVGLCISLLMDPQENLIARQVIEQLTHIQSLLFNIGSHLACDDEGLSKKLPPIGLNDIELIERQIDDLQAQLPPLKNFILPGGHKASSQLHITRCVCRRAERGIVSLNTETPVNPEILIYVNRLSDLMFCQSRAVNMSHGISETEWVPSK